MGMGGGGPIPDPLSPGLTNRPWENSASLRRLSAFVVYRDYINVSEYMGTLQTDLEKNSTKGSAM